MLKLPISITPLFTMPRRNDYTLGSKEPNISSLVFFSWDLSGLISYTCTDSNGLGVVAGSEEMLVQAKAETLCLAQAALQSEHKLSLSKFLTCRQLLTFIPCAFQSGSMNGLSVSQRLFVSAAVGLFCTWQRYEQICVEFDVIGWSGVSISVIAFLKVILREMIVHITEMRVVSLSKLL